MFSRHWLTFSVVEMTKMDSLEEGSDARIVMETLFQLAAKQLMPTIGAEAGQNEAELKESLIELWDHDFIRWVSTEVKDDSESRFFLEVAVSDGTWRPMTLPVVH